MTEIKSLKRKREEQDTTHDPDWIFVLNMQSDIFYSLLVEKEGKEKIHNVKFPSSIVSSLFTLHPGCKGTSILNLALLCKATFAHYSTIISNRFAFRCKFSESFSVYNPINLAVLKESSLPFITANATTLKIFFPIVESPILPLSLRTLSLSFSSAISSFPSSITYLKARIPFGTPSFPPNLISLYCRISDEQNDFSNWTFPSSLKHLSIYLHHTSVVLPKFPKSIIKLKIKNLCIGLLEPTNFSLPLSLVHFYLKTSSISYIPDFPSSLHVLILNVDYLDFDLPQLPLGLKTLVLPKQYKTIQYPPHLVALKESIYSSSSSSSSFSPLPTTLQYYNSSSNNTLPSSITHLLCSNRSDYPPAVTHLYINKSEVVSNIPLSVTHLTGFYFPFVDTFTTITHLSIRSHIFPEALPPNLISLKIVIPRLFTRPQPLPLLPVSLKYLSVHIFAPPLPPLPPFLQTLHIRGSLTPFSLPPLPPTLQNLLLPYKMQDEIPPIWNDLNNNVYLTEYNNIKNSNNNNNNNDNSTTNNNNTQKLVGLPQSLMLVQCPESWFKIAESYLPPQCVVGKQLSQFNRRVSFDCDL